MLKISIYRKYLTFFISVIFGLAIAGCTKAPPDPAQLRADETTLIQATVTDPARTERLLGLLDDRDSLIEETTMMLHQYRRELKSVNADYHADRDVIVEMLDQYNRDRAQKQLRFIELISDMKATTTAAEWKVIAEFQLENFNARQLVYGRVTGGN